MFGWFETRSGGFPCHELVSSPQLSKNSNFLGNYFPVRDDSKRIYFQRALYILFSWNLNLLYIFLPKRPLAFRFKNEKRKTSLMYLNHSLSKIKMEMKSKIEVTVNNLLDHKLIQECLRMQECYVYIYI